MMTDVVATTELFTEAVLLMATGMGFVFAFLSLLIFVIKWLISPLAKRFPDHETTHSEASKVSSAPVIAAISAAIKQYRHQHPPRVK